MAQDSSRPDFWDTRYRDRVMPWDAGRVPPDLRAFLKTLSSSARILVPGCGSAHEVYYLAENDFDLLEDRPASALLPVFADGERWQVWKRSG